MSTRRFRLAPLAAALLALGTLSGCGEDGGSGSTTSGPPTLDDLEGRAFTSEQVTGRDLVEGTQLSLRFDDGRAAANAGCNAMSGQASVTEGRLLVAEMASTEMACDPPLMEQEGWFADLLMAGAELALDGSTLTLTGGEATVTFAEESTQAPPLAGTLWRLEGIVHGAGDEGAVSSPPQGAENASFRIEGDTMHLVTGCNEGRGRVDYDEEVLRVEEMSITEKACFGELGRLDELFSHVFAPPSSYVIEGQSLTVRSRHGSKALLFRAGS